MLQYIGIAIQYNMTDHEHQYIVHCNMLCMAVPVTLLVWGRKCGRVENILTAKTATGYTLQGHRNGF